MERKPSHIFRPGVIIAALILTIASCKKNTDNNQYLVSNDFVVSFTVGYINNMLDIAESSYPEIADLKSFITEDIRIHKIVYRTIVDDDEVNASGLVCFPDAAGEYPVICFQNGTNTVNSYSPSEYPLNPLYQMVEAVASMGYIVVIPDYPGFGESAGIPHPYLVAEPTVTSITDMLHAVNEFGKNELGDVLIRDEYYLMGYSQGGWATLLLHKALELDYADDFNLEGSVCGAGPYDLQLLFNSMIGVTTYSMPVYIGYIVNAYSAYHQFTNPITDILREPYASKLSSLYDGTMTSEQINIELTTSIPELFTEGFISGFQNGQEYASVRSGLESNSISAWKTEIPLYLVHGEDDNTVNPITTNSIYEGLITAGTSVEVIKKEIIPGADHGNGIVPAMVKGIKFIRDLQGN